MAGEMEQQRRPPSLSSPPSLPFTLRCLFSLNADIETSYKERDQCYSWDVRDEYIRHFLHGELVTGGWGKGWGGGGGGGWFRVGGNIFTCLMVVGVGFE